MEAALIGAAAIGAGASMYSSNAANKMARDTAREQMAWQERMSNTAYQRAVADAKKAGINPIFAVGGGGASTPSGSTAQTFQADIGGNISQATSALMDYIQKKKTNELIDQQINNTKSATAKTKAEINKINQDINVNKPKENVSEITNNIVNSAKKAWSKTKFNTSDTDKHKWLNENIKKLGVSEKGYNHFKNMNLKQKMEIYERLRKARKR